MRWIVIVFVVFFSACVFCPSYYTQSSPGGSHFQLKEYLDLAFLYKEKQEYQKSLELLNKAIELVKDRGLKTDILFFKAVVLYLTGEEKKALTILKSLEKYKKDWLIYFYLALTYEDLKRYLQAKRYYLKIIEQRPIAVAFYRLAKIFKREKKWDKACYYFKKALDADPSLKIAYYHLGSCLLQMKKYQQAYSCFSKLINYYPKNIEFKKKLEYIKKKLGEKFFAERKSALERKRKKEIPPKPTYTRKRGVPTVRVKILEAEAVSFKCGEDFIIYYKNQVLFRGMKNRIYTLRLHQNGVALGYKNKIVKLLPSPIEVKSKGSFYFLDIKYGKGDFWYKCVDNAFRGDFQFYVKDKKIFVINKLTLEEYLYGVVPAEILPSSPMEALKAQAVCARTIAYRNLGRYKKEDFDFYKDIRCQVYRGISVETERVRKAVDATRGEVIFYKDIPIEAFYHANCGGCLRSDAFGKKKYLFSGRIDSYTLLSFSSSGWNKEKWFKSYPDCFCRKGKINNFRWQRIYDAQDFSLVFLKSLKSLRKIEVLKYGDCAHINKIFVEFVDRKDTIEGDYRIRNYFDGLKSTAFIIEFKYKRSGNTTSIDKIIIWGAGFGHGVGLCQEGAIQMAKEGFSYTQIIEHYYKDVKIKKVY